jgi:small GTP-binding protein
MGKGNASKGFVFKITVIGDGAVGKTSLIKKYTKGGFEKDYIKTIGAQFSKYDEEIEEDNCKLLFWDIAGQREYDFMRPTFYKGSKAAIIVFSHTDSKSFDHISNWYDEIKEHAGNLPIVLFGNKTDLVDAKDLDDELVQDIVKENGFLGYFKTSAKTGQGVFEAFQAIINNLYHKYKEA